METYDLIMTITDEAKKELSKTLARVNLDSGKYLRLTTPPVWAGEGDFGIVIDEMSEGDHLIDYHGTTILIMDSDLVGKFPNAVLDFKITDQGSRFTLDIY
tara:strand:- start:374 stop:676 length:303 start_codon:yes stop_codon:yes gene_type:complete